MKSESPNATILVNGMLFWHLTGIASILAQASNAELTGKGQR
jgi:hypothetical protein